MTTNPTSGATATPAESVPPSAARVARPPIEWATTPTWPGPPLSLLTRLALLARLLSGLLPTLLAALRLLTVLRLLPLLLARRVLLALLLT